MKDPAVLFYFQDFLVGTEFMTDDEVGKYIRILCHLADKGTLTEVQLKRICKTENVPSAIMEKLLHDDAGNFYQHRMKTEREKRIKYSESRRDNRKQKSEDMNKTCKTHVKHMENENENINVNEDILNLYKGVEIFFDEDCRPKTEKAKSEWYDTLDKLIRIDGYSPEHIHDVIKRTRMDDFWRTNFLSILKLRKKNKDGIPYFTVFEKKLNHETIGRNNSKPASGEELTDFYAGQYGTNAAEYRK